MGKNQTASRELDTNDYQDQSEFRYAVRRFLRFSELQARKEGIPPQQHLLLLMVRGHPSYPRATIGDLAERLQIKHHSASLLVERCVQRGLLRREADQADRRRALVSLTPEGDDVLERITLANREELMALENQLFKQSFVDSIRRRRELPAAKKS